MLFTDHEGPEDWTADLIEFLVALVLIGFLLVLARNAALQDIHTTLNHIGA